MQLFSGEKNTSLGFSNSPGSKILYWKEESIFGIRISRQNNISDLGANNITYVSGCTPMIFECIMKGKNGIDLMLDILNSNRYLSVTI